MASTRHSTNLRKIVPPPVRLAPGVGKRWEGGGFEQVSKKGQWSSLTAAPSTHV